jgi:hypothetical protein
LKPTTKTVVAAQKLQTGGKEIEISASAHTVVGMGVEHIPAYAHYLEAFAGARLAGWGGRIRIFAS